MLAPFTELKVSHSKSGHCLAECPKEVTIVLPGGQKRVGRVAVLFDLNLKGDGEKLADRLLGWLASVHVTELAIVDTLYTLAEDTSYAIRVSFGPDGDCLFPDVFFLAPKEGKEIQGHWVMFMDPEIG